MKALSKEFIIKGLRISIDLALIIQIIGVVFLILALITTIPLDSSGNFAPPDPTMSSPLNGVLITLSKSNLNLAGNIQTISNEFFLFCFLCNLINVVALILITLQLRYIFKSFALADYFNSSNSIRIKKMALIILIWAFVDYAIRFLPDQTIIGNFITSSIGVNSFKHGIIQGLIGFNLKMLVTSILIFFLSIVFKYGNKLQEESSLTI